MNDLFTPVSSGRVSQQIVDQIQSAIREGQLQPGDRLPSERELADRFGVSRVTVRDALRSLEVLDLVRIRVGAAGGAFVQSPGTEVVGQGLTNLLLLSSVTPDHVAEARLVIEFGTVGLATIRASADELDQLVAMVDQAESDVAADRYDTSQSVAFHTHIAEIAGNDAVGLLASSFRGALSMRPLRQHEPVGQAHTSTVAEHRAVAKAMRDRDVAAAQRAMANHLLRGISAPAQVEAVLFGDPTGEIAAER